MIVESIQLQRVRTFNQVGLNIQEALSVDNILHSIGNGLKEIGLTCVILFLDKDQKNLRIEYTSIAPSLVRSIEKILGIKSSDFKISLEEGMIYTPSVREKRAVFDNRRREILKKVLPTPLVPFAGRIAGMMKLASGISAPLISRGKVLGVLDVLSPDLSEADIPTVVAFANQAAIAIDNALLLSESEAKAKKIIESEVKHRSLFELSPFAIITMDLNGVITSCNTAVQGFTGYAEDDIVGKHFSKLGFLRLRDIPKHVEIMSVALDGNGKVPKPFEVTYYHKDKSPRLAEVHIGLHKVDGKVVGLQTVFEDITERRQMEEELRNSEQHHRVLMETASNFGEGIIIAHDFEDNRGVIAFVNDAMTKILGYSREELLQKKMRDFVTTVSTQQIEERYIKRRAGDETEDHYETVALAKDGTEVPLEVQTDNTTFQGKPAIVVFVRDITERRKMEAQLTDYSRSLERMVEDRSRELRIADERYRAVFEHSGLAMGVFDKNGVVQLLNTEVEKLFGYTAEELVGEKAPGFLLIPEDLHEEATWITKELKEKRFVDGYETERVRRDGSRFPIELTIAALKDEEGKTTGFTFIGRDITERKRLEKEKEEAQQQLMTAERLSAIGELASIVGHELRNPLAVISNSVYFLKLKLGDSDEKVKKHLGILEGEVAISSSIISNILDFARPKQPVFQDIDINSVVEQALEKYTVPDNVKVVTEIGKGLPHITADAEQLRQVFVNMISNAAQAMPEEGELLIRTAQNDDTIKVEFEDTGVGISPENLEKILQPMFTTKAKGVGLGLTISKRIVENHHGNFEVSSQVGQGTTFTITLPVGEKDEK